MMLTLGVLATLALAVRQDLAQHSISNVLAFGAMAIAIGIHSLAYGSDGALHALGGVAVGLLCFMPLYLAKGMSAGDVKLMAAAGAFIGPSQALNAVLLSLAIGAVLAIGILVLRVVEHCATKATANASAAVRPDLRARLSRVGKERFPYATAIALGVVLAMWMEGQLNPLFRSPS
ncbi:MAG: A24 family peptidase [Steroidobacteraceae bacterium]